MAFVNLSTGCTNSKEDFNAYYSVCRVLSPKKKSSHNLDGIFLQGLLNLG